MGNHRKEEGTNSLRNPKRNRWIKKNILASKVLYITME
jgi:hypothetical protein